MISMQVLRDSWSLWGDRGPRCIFALISSLQIGNPWVPPQLLAAAHCWHDGNLRIIGHARCESACVPDVLIANEDVDMLADLILLVEYSIPDSRIGIPKCGK